MKLFCAYYLCRELKVLSCVQNLIMGKVIWYSTSTSRDTICMPSTNIFQKVQRCLSFIRSSLQGWWLKVIELKLSQELVPFNVNRVSLISYAHDGFSLTDHIDNAKEFLCNKASLKCFVLHWYPCKKKGENVNLNTKFQIFYSNQFYFDDLQLVMHAWLIIITGTTSTLVKLAGDWVSDIRKLLLLLSEVLSGGAVGVLLEPVGGLLDSLEKLAIISI